MRDLRQVVFDHVQRLHQGFFDRYPVGRLVTRATSDVENVAEMFSAGLVLLVTDVLRMAGFARSPVPGRRPPRGHHPRGGSVPCARSLRVPLEGAGRLPRHAHPARADQRHDPGDRDRHEGGAALHARGAQPARLRARSTREHKDAWLSLDLVRLGAVLGGGARARHHHRDGAVGGHAARPRPARSTSSWTGCGASSCRCSDLSAKYSVMQSSMASLERIFQLLDTKPAIVDPPADAAASPAREGGPRGEVEFQNVWFAYSGRGLGAARRLLPRGAGRARRLRGRDRRRQDHRDQAAGPPLRGEPRPDPVGRRGLARHPSTRASAPGGHGAPGRLPVQRHDRGEPRARAPRARPRADPARGRGRGGRPLRRRACRTAMRPTCASAARTSPRASASCSLSRARSRTARTCSCWTRPPARSTPRPRR